ncbi:erythromycin esterase family protein [Streptomyces sp. NPDC049879]|uniref:erythromycin esterase family protein n=1 Tax=Streptomyces sp. NPDC049879 TaxID=3365598 RepID=UPI0037AB5914
MTPLTRRAALGAFALPALTALPLAPGARARDADVTHALARAARPLDDLRPLGRAIGDAPVVGLGEVVHGAHELYELKHRVFRHLVAEKGFTAFALEVSWSAGLRLDAYVRSGSGDPRRIMDDEFGGGAWPWHVEEYLALFRWMREHNRRHERRPVRFVGADLSQPRLGEALFDGVLAYVGRYRPHALPEFEDCYRELRARPTAADFAALPPADRERLAGLARRAAERLPAPGRPAATPYAWAAQHAWNIAETTALLATDFSDHAQHRQALRRRDALMAHNVAWWHRHVGGKVLVSAHNGHTAYATYDPDYYPTTQGAFLRERLGRDYLAIGTTFGHGERVDTGPDGRWATTAFPPPQRGSSEETLERAARLAGHRDVLLDPRTVPAPARAWLATPRPTRDIGHPDDPYRQYVLAEGHDVLIHLGRLHGARPLT